MKEYYIRFNSKRIKAKSEKEAKEKIIQELQKGNYPTIDYIDERKDLTPKEREQLNTYREDKMKNTIKLLLLIGIGITVWGIIIYILYQLYIDFVIRYMIR